MMELMKTFYKAYVEEAKEEFGDETKVMSFEAYCKFYEIDETTSEERIMEIFTF